jgi:nucleotide-binding universal stress UspA family protein
MKILVPTDGSEYSEAALQALCNRSWPEGTEITIFSVLEPLVSMIDPALIQYESRIVDELHELQTQYTKDAKSKLQKELPTCSIKVILANGNVKDEILKFAIASKADLIVMGSHGRSGFEKLLLGSVAQYVVSRSPCAVEVVKLPPRRTATPAKPVSEHAKV